jgi:hypothetical protein
VGVGVEAAGSAVGTGSKEWRRTVGENSCDRREVGEIVEGTATFEEIHSARSVFRVHRLPFGLRPPVARIVNSASDTATRDTLLLVSGRKLCLKNRNTKLLPESVEIQILR